MPSMTPILDGPLTTSFADIKKVYNLECKKPLRIAHHLTKTVLNPNSIEKVNVKLALAVFHESTVIVLKEYGFHKTASANKFFSSYRKMSSMYLRYINGFLWVFCKKFSSRLAMKILEYYEATFVPIAVPLSCKNCWFPG